MIVSGIILFLATIVFNARLDYSIWKRQINAARNVRNHVTGAIIKAATVLPSLIMLAIASNFRWVIALIVTAFLLWTYFLLLFEGAYNIFRGEPFFFRGTEDGKDDAKLDNFWQSLPEWFYITLKLVLPAVATYLYYLGLIK